MHGSPVAVERLLAAALSCGARAARAGEFTERAFRAGRIDLVRAEAVRDLIESRTPEAARASARRLAGGLSARLQAVREELLSASSALEASIDFSEDVGEGVDSSVRARLEAAIVELDRLASSARTGRLLNHGCRVAILGRPNAGKSTLFNAALGRDRAIVTEVAGTTRDTLEAEIDVGGVPVTLVDTAGLRRTGDLVEARGVERARAEAERADAAIYVFDGSSGLEDDDAEALALLAGRPLILAANKSDRRTGSASPLPPEAVLFCGLSAEAGPMLRTLLEARIAGEISTDASSEMLGSLRQADLVARARAAAAEAKDALDRGVSPEYAATHCHGALDALSDLVGETTSEDVLARLFSTFCIGK